MQPASTRVLCFCLFSCKTEPVKPILVSFLSSECLDEQISFEDNKLKNRIISESISDTIHNYNIFVITNCSFASIGGFELKRDTIHLKYKGRSRIETYKINDSTEITEEVTPMADCDCAFELNYKIKGLKNNKYVIKANDKIISKSKHKYQYLYEPKYEIVKNDTINYYNIYGFKEGLHIERRNDRVISKLTFKNGVPQDGLYHRRYHKNGNVKEETLMSNEKFTTKKQYNSSGKLIKECEIEYFDFDEGINCINYN